MLLSGEVGGNTGQPGQDATTDREMNFFFPANSIAGAISVCRVPYDGVINLAEAVVAGSNTTAAFDFAVNAYASHTGAFIGANSICAGNYLTLTSAVKVTDATLTGWSKSVTKGQYVYAQLKSSPTPSLAGNIQVSQGLVAAS